MSPEPARRLASRPLALVLLFLGVVAVYGQTLGFELVWDDPDIIRNAEVRFRDGGWPGILKADYGYVEEAPTGYWRPFTQTVLLLADRITGGRPWLLHAGSLLLYAACVAAFYLLALALLPSPPAALLAALLFALHPLHAESVAQVTNLHDPLAGTFLFLSAWCWAKDRRGTRPWRLIAGAACLLAAGLSKEPGVLLPASLLLWDLVESGRRGLWARNRRWLAAWGSALGAYLLLRLWLFGSPLGSLGSASAASPSLVDPLLLPGRLATYLSLLVAPFRVRIWYERPEVAIGIVSLMGTVLFFWLLWWGWGRERERLGGKTLLWIGVFLLPVMGLVPIGGALVAARHLFLASAGVCLLAGAWGWEQLRRWPRPTAVAVAILPLALGSAAFVHASHWRDDLTLFRQVNRDNPRGSLAPGRLLDVAMDRGNLSEAVRWGRRGVEATPDSPRAWALLGSALGAAGDLTGAEQAARRAARLSPAWYHPRLLLGIALQAQGRLPEAADELRRAMELGPGRSPVAPARRAEVLTALGRNREAEEALREGLAHFPRDPLLLAEMEKVRSSGGGPP